MNGVLFLLFFLVLALFFLFSSFSLSSFSTSSPSCFPSFSLSLHFVLFSFDDLFIGTPPYSRYPSTFSITI